MLPPGSAEQEASMDMQPQELPAMSVMLDVAGLCGNNYIDLLVCRDVLLCIIVVFMVTSVGLRASAVYVKFMTCIHCSVNVKYHESLLYTYWLYSRLYA